MSEIEALQVELDKKRNELSQVLGRFSEEPPLLKRESAEGMVPSLFARRVAYSGNLDSIARSDFARPKFRRVEKARVRKYLPALTFVHPSRKHRDNRD